MLDQEDPPLAVAHQRPDAKCHTARKTPMQMQELADNRFRKPHQT